MHIQPKVLGILHTDFWHQSYVQRIENEDKDELVLDKLKF